MKTRERTQVVEGMCIKTKYIGPTNYKGTRIKAIHKRDNERTWTKTISWDYSLEAKENHLEAAKELIKSWDMKEFYPDMKIVSCGWDHEHYYFIVS